MPKIKLQDAILQKLGELEAGDEGAEAIAVFVAEVFGISIVDEGHSKVIRVMDAARAQLALHAEDSARVDTGINGVRGEEQRILGLADTTYPECAPAGGGTFETGEPEQPHRNRPDDGDSL